MKIAIGEKIAPFSHEPGKRCLVPGTDWVVQPFPAHLIVGDAHFPIGVTGPVKEFTIQLDLERMRVWVWAIANEGYYRYSLEGVGGGIALTVDRAPKGGLSIGPHTLAAKEKILLVSGGRHISKPIREKVSLGNLKAQDWDLAMRRMDLKEIVPALFLLGQVTPDFPHASGGSASFLPASLDLFVRVGLSDLIVPQLTDTKYQGICRSDGSGDPIALLSQAYLSIRSCLIEECNPVLKILPRLPKDWDAGRATQLLVAGIGAIDLEWSRNAIRQMVVRADRDSKPTIQFVKSVKSFRLNGKSVENSAELIFEASKVYQFDRFQK